MKKHVEFGYSWACHRLAADDQLGVTARKVRAEET